MAQIYLCSTALEIWFVHHKAAFPESEPGSHWWWRRSPSTSSNPSCLYMVVNWPWLMLGSGLGKELAVVLPHTFCFLPLRISRAAFLLSLCTSSTCWNQCLWGRIHFLQGSRGQLRHPKTLGWQNKTKAENIPSYSSSKSLLICRGREKRIAPFKDRNIQMKKF